MTLAAFALLAALTQAGTNPCLERGTLVLVDTHSRRLTVCEGSVPARTHPVALGWRGVGKRRRGDAKTPLGLYPLGAPRPSRKFGTFIPVGYPTPEQRRHGFSGSAIGLHGPERDTKNAGLANVAYDWTLGCIAVADDPTIKAIAAWVRAHPDAAILIE
jgi:murein L,D-transpeptidase YafK